MKLMIVALMLLLLISCSARTTNTNTTLQQEAHENLKAGQESIKELITEQKQCPSCVCVPCKNETYDKAELQEQIEYLKRRIDYYQGMEDEELLYNLTRQYEKCNETLHEVNESLQAIRDAIGGD